MAPQGRIRELEQMDAPPVDAREAGVLALIYPGTSALAHVLLILRPSYPGVHSGQVALPGGGREPEDRSLQHTALREAREEVGVVESEVQLLRPLSPLYIPPSNYTVAPYVGWCNYQPVFQPDPSEVAGLIEVPLKELVHPGRVVSKAMKTSYSQRIEVPGFSLGGHMVWGATAMILSELRALIREVI